MSSTSVHNSPPWWVRRTMGAADDRVLAAQCEDLAWCEQAGYGVICSWGSRFYWPGYGHVASWDVTYRHAHDRDRPHFVLRYPLQAFPDAGHQSKFLASVCRRNARVMGKHGIIADPDARKALDVCP